MIDAAIGSPHIITELLNENINNDFQHFLTNNPKWLDYQDGDYTDSQFKDIIKEFYRNILNYEIDDSTYIVLGIGATSLINSYCYTISKIMNKTIRVSSYNTIHYPLHKDISFIHNCIYVPNTEQSDLYIITSPNNPDGSLLEDTYIIQNQSYKLFDIVYNSPQFTGKFELLNANLLLGTKSSFVSSFSKFGIPGCRCGYLLTKDKQIYEQMNMYNDIHTNSISTTGFYIMKYFYNRYFNTRQFYETVYILIQTRINVFIDLCKRNDIKILNKSFMCPFIYTDKSFSWWMNTYKVNVKCGTVFNDDNCNSRINIMMAHNDWNQLTSCLCSSSTFP